MRTTILFLFLFALVFSCVTAQDTFSIVAMDEETGEVGSAGASCVDLAAFPGFSDDFLGELLPGKGAINTQAFYNQTNQINARNRMNEGFTPSEIITWLALNDVNNQPQFRQYGIVGINNGNVTAAASTGGSTNDYKNHMIGPNYAIQGNILLGQEILDSMEARFLRAEGDLACKLMAALQGANVVGADTRCAGNGTSSLFAFVKVAQPDDEFGDPSFVLSVRTSDGDGIEPIDSLQVLFDLENDCMNPTSVNDNSVQSLINIYPNPTSDFITIHLPENEVFTLSILNSVGQNIVQQKMTTPGNIDVSDFEAGVYTVMLFNDAYRHVEKIVVQK